MATKKTENRVFVFTEDLDDSARTKHARPMKYAIPESHITEIKSQSGSENCYLVVNGMRVRGTFDGLIAQLGTRVDINT